MAHAGLSVNAALTGSSAGGLIQTDPLPVTGCRLRVVAGALRQSGPESPADSETLVRANGASWPQKESGAH